MKRIRFSVFSALVVLVMLCGAGKAVAQGSVNVVKVYASANAEAKCGPMPAQDLNTVSFYFPKFRSAAQAYTRIEKVPTASYMCMKTSLPQYRANGGYGWVAEPAVNVGYTADGQAYFLGSDDGQYLRCHNHILAIFTFQEVNESYNMGGTTPTQPTVTANANANANATATAAVCVPRAPTTTETVNGDEKTTIWTDGCTTKEKVYVKEENGWGWKEFAVGAISGGGGMYVACRTIKFCGTRKVTQILTSYPKVQGTPRGQPTLNPQGLPQTRVPTRRVILPNYMTESYAERTSAGNTSTSTQTQASQTGGPTVKVRKL